MRSAGPLGVLPSLMVVQRLQLLTLLGLATGEHIATWGMHAGTNATSQAWAAAHSAPAAAGHLADLLSPSSAGRPELHPVPPCCLPPPGDPHSLYCFNASPSQTAKGALPLIATVHTFASLRSRGTRTCLLPPLVEAGCSGLHPLLCHRILPAGLL